MTRRATRAAASFGRASTMSVKDRRKALGIDRKTLAQHAYVDPPTVQLIELGYDADATVLERIDKTLSALEAGEAPPNWKAQVDQEIANDPDAQKFGSSS